ncbi:MAG: hypothetical protein U1D55_03175 [Phycisphaerae bacterium]
MLLISAWSLEGSGECRMPNWIIQLLLMLGNLADYLLAGFPM